MSGPRVPWALASPTRQRRGAPRVTDAEQLAAVAGPGNLWSFGSLQRFVACPWSWFGRYIRKWTDPPSAPLVMGRLTHAVIAQAVRAGTDPPAWTQWLHAARAQEPAQALVRAGHDADMLRWAQTAVAALPTHPDTVVEAAWIAPMAVDPAAPRPTGLTFAAVEEALARDQPYAWFRAQDALRAAGVDGLLARPDWVGAAAGRVEIRDWKTAHVRREQTATTVADRYRDQLLLYAVVARRRFPGRAVTTAVHLLPADVVVPTPAAPDTLSTTARRWFTVIQDVKQAARVGVTAFPKRPGEACRYCALALWGRGQATCPEGAAFRRHHGWDRWDAIDRERRAAAGIAWPGDSPTPDMG